ncbi:MAG: hypothetical protein HPY53_11625 [Brevinematales bacterium]|nr:hypothetical protein [Brevinematales bacterium]
MKRLSLFIIIFTFIGLQISCTTEPTIEKDATPPAIAVTSPTNGQEVGTSFVLSGIVSDNGSGVDAVYYKTDNGVYAQAATVNGNWSANLNVTNYGKHTNYIFAKDKAGNESQVISIWVERTSIPSILIISPANGTMTNTQNLTVSGSASVDSPYGISNVQVKLNNGSWVNATGTLMWAKSLILSEGTNFIYARVLSDNGKTNSSSEWKIVKWSMPLISISSPVNGISTNAVNITISGVSSVPLPYSVSKVQIQLNGGTWTNASGTISWSKSLTLIHGTNTVYARVISDNGKTNQSIMVKIIKYSVYKVIANDGAANDNFGTCVAISQDGNTVIVGSPGDNFSKGSVYRYNWNGSTWVENKFIAFDGLNNDWFGYSVAISADGNTFIVGAYNDDSGVGAVYHFHWNGSVWLTNKFIAYDGNTSDNFGISVTITPDGNFFGVGSWSDDDKGSASGSIYRFHWNGSVWLTNKFIAYDGAPNDNLGVSIAISQDGETVIAGAFGDDVSKGAVYRFHWNGSVWMTNKFSAYDGMSYDFFGNSIAISSNGDTIVVGAREDDDKGDASGSVFCFQWNGMIWTTNKFVAFDGTAGDYFGNSVSLSSDGDTIIAAALLDDGKGSVYSFKWNGLIWNTNKFVAFDGATGDSFGVSAVVSSSGNAIISGAWWDDDNGDKSGSVYIFKW